MIFADIHNHALFATDDGPKSEKDMYALIDEIYKDNIRHLCLTPHFHPGYFGENGKRARRAFAVLEAYIKEKYPDLVIYKGNELRYNRGCENWVKEGMCNTINGTQYLLVDFSENERAEDIVNGTNRILNAGYVPILAHVERYRRIPRNMEMVMELKGNGVIVQIDSQSVTGMFGLFSKLRSKKLLDLHLVDVVATDSHGTKRRAPSMTQSYEYIKKNYGEEYAELICSVNPLAILNDKYIGRN
ncbi:MAG: hypothetical protein E7652_02925 [Ruminococcaceae bacterium]|nr:hypothetical protein [Oscillospiraceae bacterium]